ncbi:MAG: imidazole glycerol phosphate synthase subunit HisH [Granulosicoccus sp.]
MYVDIVDVGCGNIGSIRNWVENTNISTRVVSNVRELKSQIIVLPGVGAAGYYLKSLRASNFDNAILEHVDKGGRLIGICLGFQAMSDFCEENSGHRGLGLIKGEVKKLNGLHSNNQWQPFKLSKDRMGVQSFYQQANLTKKRTVKGRVFFNHEYGFVVDDKKAYSQPINKELSNYSAVAVKDRIIGMQFHPEKSQKTGLEIIQMIL